MSLIELSIWIGASLVGMVASATMLNVAIEDFQHQQRQQKLQVPLDKKWK